MIIDNIRNAAMYSGLGVGLGKALAYLRETDWSGKEPGKYTIDGDNVYALVQQFSLLPQSEGKWEAHRQYIDVHYMVEGKERIAYAPVDSLDVYRGYDETADYMLLRGGGSTNVTTGENTIVVSPGTFLIFRPEDAHMIGIAVDTPKPVTKVVVKVRCH
ncbi:YhcH/YjgK/YiaL family protein [Paenibacillus cymbidii]|uniref:YhcH/YjgK/YiaL family protein n=1 Tax=Paenibacillus cymbidii TaxID=1639034 RepID=UPI001436C979|nr:YhcH/YjgK/YiaL family protein [Paenibacillus cymbidii]